MASSDDDGDVDDDFDAEDESYQAGSVAVEHCRCSAWQFVLLHLLRPFVYRWVTRLW